MECRISLCGILKSEYSKKRLLHYLFKESSSRSTDFGSRSCKNLDICDSPRDTFEHPKFSSSGALLSPLEIKVIIDGSSSGRESDRVEFYFLRERRNWVKPESE